LDWTLEDYMVDGVIFCATLTGCRGGHTSFVQAGVQMPNTNAVAVEPDPRCSSEGHAEKVRANIEDENSDSCWVV